jgi:hypothetical protein
MASKKVSIAGVPEEDSCEANLMFVETNLLRYQQWSIPEQGFFKRGLKLHTQTPDKIDQVHQMITNNLKYTSLSIKENLPVTQKNKGSPE